MTATVSANVVEGKFGFYPCDRETYKKLKRLNYLSFLSLHADACFDRWNAKQPQNRIFKHWSRNSQGQKVSFVPGDPVPEPKKGCSLFRDLVKTGMYSSAWRRDFISSDYVKAKYPQKAAELVQGLHFTVKEIDEMLVTAEAWFAQF